LGCPKCGEAVSVPALPPRPPVNAQAGDPVFARDVFLMDQNHWAVNEKYYITDKDGKALMFAERPVFVVLNIFAAGGGFLAGALNMIITSGAVKAAKAANLPQPPVTALSLWLIFGTILVMVVTTMFLLAKRNITVYRDDRRSAVLLKITQDFRVPLLSSAYTVLGPDGALIARLFKKRLRNIFRKRWYGLGPDGKVLFVAMEDSMVLSALRRAMFGFFGFLHTNFVIYGKTGLLGEFNRRLTMQDRYVLDLGADSLRALDRRAAVALGVLLDTGEGR
ncbi:MAG: hypothetical protein A3J79_10445, partial [Elusimicrobia bacterium RIFOXYB2_FULL_62_6]